MTTIAFADSILAADTKITVSKSSYGHINMWYRRGKKIYANPFYVVAGAGSSYFYAIIKYIPFILAIRFLGFVVFPFFGSKNAMSDLQNLSVFWRTGQVWTFDIVCVKKGSFIYARVKNKMIVKKFNNISFIAGSGAELFDISRIDKLGSKESVIEASKLDEHTNDEVLMFDIQNWKFLNEIENLQYPVCFLESVLGTTWFDTSSLTPDRREKLT